MILHAKIRHDFKVKHSIDKKSTHLKSFDLRLFVSKEKQYSR